MAAQLSGVAAVSELHEIVSVRRQVFPVLKMGTPPAPRSHAVSTNLKKFVSEWEMETGHPQPFGPHPTVPF